jgi:hypothetical protein
MFRWAMRNRNLTREEALEEYIIYRKRVRELLDMAQIARDIRDRKYEPQDFSGRGPDRFSVTVGDVMMGLFSSLCDINPAALNVFDVWLALFPEKKHKINETWKKVEPNIQLIRDYRNNVVAHANKNLRRFVETRSKFNEKLAEVHATMQAVIDLGAELSGDEQTILRNLRAEIAPILKKSRPDLSNQQIEGLKDYFLQVERNADRER